MLVSGEEVSILTRSTICRKKGECPYDGVGNFGILGVYTLYHCMALYQPSVLKQHLKLQEASFIDKAYKKSNLE